MGLGNCVVTCPISNASAFVLPRQHRLPMSGWQKTALQSFTLVSSCFCLEVTCFIAIYIAFTKSHLVFPNLKGTLSYNQSLINRRKTRHIEKELLHLF